MIRINKIKHTDAYVSFSCFNCCRFLNVFKTGIRFFYDFTPSDEIVDNKMYSADNRKRLRCQFISYVADFD